VFAGIPGLLRFARNGTGGKLIFGVAFVGAAFCRPQAGAINKNKGSYQARAAECRPYGGKIDFDKGFAV